MNILETIVRHKRKELVAQRQEHPPGKLEKLAAYQGNCNRMELGQGPGIIAEFKRRSPSKGLINGDAQPVEVAGAYLRAGVSAMSVLTDVHFFGGTLDDLARVREAYPELPLLRKDFIIDPYQLHEAKAYGADLVLLIAAILDRAQVADLSREACSLGLDILLEVHSEKELEVYDPGIRFVGVNNRDLKTFRVDTNLSRRMMAHMPEGVVAVSESGISRAEEVRDLAGHGYRLFLMGEAFMKSSDPGLACRQFIQSL